MGDINKRELVEIPYWSLLRLSGGFSGGLRVMLGPFGAVFGRSWSALPLPLGLVTTSHGNPSHTITQLKKLILAGGIFVKVETVTGPCYT